MFEKLGTIEKLEISAGSWTEIIEAITVKPRENSLLK